MDVIWESLISLELSQIELFQPHIIKNNIPPMGQHTSLYLYISYSWYILYFTFLVYHKSLLKVSIALFISFTSLKNAQKIGSRL